MILDNLYEKKLIDLPKFILTNTHYISKIGSFAYGCAGDDSDQDCYGFVIPKKEEVFPWLKGELLGFGRHAKRFEQWEKIGIIDKEENKKYDFHIYSIVKFFNLAMECNPGFIDCLFVPQNCIMHITQIGNLVRENRKIFLSKLVKHRMSGYAMSQLHKAQGKNPKKNSKRHELREKYGVDTKFLYHVYRLIDECEQILTIGDLDLQRGKEVMKAIRRGEWKIDDMYKWFTEKELHLEKLYSESKLPYSPDEEKIKQLLLNCLEQHYGNLSNCIVQPDKYLVALNNIKEILEKAKI